MITEEDLLAELNEASLAKIIIYDKYGNKSFISEFRGNSIKKIIETIQKFREQTK